MVKITQAERDICQLKRRPNNCSNRTLVFMTYVRITTVVHPPSLHHYPNKSPTPVSPGVPSFAAISIYE
jgi:hypothetical protein